MSIEPEVLRYVGVYEEPNNAYNTDNSAALGSFLAVPWWEGSLKIGGNRVPLDPMAGKVRADAHSQKVHGPRKCSVGFDVCLHSHGVDLDGNAVSVPTTSTWALLRILQAMLGGSIATTNPGVQTTVQAGTTATLVNVTAGHGNTRFQVGGAIACECISGTTNVIEAREILSVAANAVTVKEAFSAIPVTGRPVRGAVTVYPKEDPDTSLQVFVEGRELDDRFVFCGLQGKLALAIALNGLSKLSFDLQGAYWNALSAGAGITIPSYANFSPVPCVAAELTVPTVGSTTRVLVHQTGVKIEIGMEYEDIPSGAVAEGLRRKRRKPARPLVKGSFITPFEDLTWKTAHDNRTSHGIFQQLGNAPGSTLLISVPTAQITGTPQRVPAGVAAGFEVPWEGRLDEAIAGATEVTYAGARFHFL